MILIPLSAAEIIAAKKKRIGSLFAAAGIISVGIPAALGLLIAANWEWVFITFHKLVFQNDYWLFDPYTDPFFSFALMPYGMYLFYFFFVSFFHAAKKARLPASTRSIISAAQCIKNSSGKIVITGSVYGSNSQ